MRQRGAPQGAPLPSRPMKTTYRLRDGLSYCEVDGHLIFLDLTNDLYFELPKSLRPTFTACLKSSGNVIDASEMLKRNILVATSSTSFPEPKPSVNQPRQSVVEQTSCSHRMNIATLGEVFAIVLLAQLRLKTRRLSVIVESIEKHRQNTTISPPSADPSCMQRLLQAVGDFMSFRPYVPIENRCLLDALSLVTFLSRRRLFSHLVFGVTYNPFSAHCWVQVGDIVLNDTVGNATSYTPIRIV